MRQTTPTASPSATSGSVGAATSCSSRRVLWRVWLWHPERAFSIAIGSARFIAIATLSLFPVPHAAAISIIAIVLRENDRFFPGVLRHIDDAPLTGMWLLLVPGDPFAGHGVSSLGLSACAASHSRTARAKGHASGRSVCW